MYLYKDLQDEVKRRATRDQGGTQFDVAVDNIVNLSMFSIAREAPWKQLRRFDTIDTETNYTTGTGAVSVTNGSKSVTVTGATFITNGIQVGRRITLGGSNKNYTIATITGETTLTVDINYDGTTSTTQSYKIYGREEYNLPPNMGRLAMIWHEEFGYTHVLDYVPTFEFNRANLDQIQEDIPTHYRTWLSNFVEAQPLEGSVVTIASSSSADTSKIISVFGTVSGYPDSEQITTNSSDGTTSASGSKSFTKIERIVKNATTTGRITCTTNSGNVTVAVLPTGDTTAGIMRHKFQLWPIPNSVFPLHIFYYKQPYRMVNDQDVHELGQEFDEAIINLSVAKIKYESNQKEGDRFFSMYQNEMRTLRRLNADKLDWIPTMKRSEGRGNGAKLHRHLSYMQLGGSFGPRGL